MNSKGKKDNRRIKWIALAGCILALLCCCVGKERKNVEESCGEDREERIKVEEKQKVDDMAAVESGKYCVVIDAGHGGDDPGKIGVNQLLEKDVNLDIALRIKNYLEKQGVSVVMTREDENGLYKEEDANKKVQDMKRRVEIIEESKGDLAVSIHQNSYPEEYIHGAQVFYYTAGAEGKKLAECLQKQLIEKVDPDNDRQIKGNDSYYLLKKTKIPTVIVECGFLSNREEADNLADALYREKIAYAISFGIVEYLKFI